LAIYLSVSGPRLLEPIQRSFFLPGSLQGYFPLFPLVTKLPLGHEGIPAMDKIERGR
jgi:hypothetical protein